MAKVARFAPPTSKQTVSQLGENMSKVLLGEDGLDCRPHDVAPDCWYYEESDGLHVYWNGKLVCIIKWRSLCASVARANTASARRGGTVAKKDKVAKPTRG